MIVREQRRTPEQASAITSAIRQAFPSGRIAPDDYESIIETVPGADPDDRVHGAAALFGGATALITANPRHFDVDFFGAHGVVVENPEIYLLRRLEHAPDHLIETVKRVLAMKTRPPWTVGEYLGRLDRAGAPDFASALRGRMHG